MATSIRTSVLLLAVVSLSFGKLHRIDDLVDGILADLRTNYKPVLELDDLKEESKTGNLNCFNGTGSSLASLVRHGHAREVEIGYGPQVWANFTIEPFTFGYEECAIINDTDYEIIGPIGGSTMFSSGDFGLTVESKDENCNVSIIAFNVDNFLVVFDKAYDNSTIFQRIDRNRMKNAVKQEIISSIKFILDDYIGTKYNNATMCN